MEGKPSSKPIPGSNQPPMARISIGLQAIVSEGRGDLAGSSVSAEDQSLNLIRYPKAAKSALGFHAQPSPTHVAPPPYRRHG